MRKYGLMAVLIIVAAVGIALAMSAMAADRSKVEGAGGGIAAQGTHAHAGHGSCGMHGAAAQPSDCTGDCENCAEQGKCEIKGDGQCADCTGDCATCPQKETCPHAGATAGGCGPGGGCETGGGCGGHEAPKAEPKASAT